MRRLVIRTALFLATVFVALGNTPTTKASTITDFNGSNSLDSATGLLWLDLTLSANLSYNYVTTQFGVGGLFAGYRYASVAEVSTLFTNADITNPNLSGANSETPAYLSLIALMGPTGNGLFGITGTQNLLIPGTHILADLGFCCGGLQSVFFNSWAQDSIAQGNLGSFLVAPAAVPLPAALPLFAAGVGAMGFIGWRKKKRKPVAAD